VENLFYPLEEITLVVTDSQEECPFNLFCYLHRQIQSKISIGQFFFNFQHFPPPLYQRFCQDPTKKGPWGSSL
jgi:hypothetical protein